MRLLATSLALSLALAITTPASAAPAPPEPSGARVDTPPEEASGIREPEPIARWRRIPRALLFVPRAMVTVVLAPPRLAMWAFSRYQLEDRFYRTFFNEAGTIGLFPLVSYESGLGLHAGARFVHRDLIGEGGRLGLSAGAGGSRAWVAAGAVSSGDILGDAVELELAASFQSRRRSRFFGYGNGDLEDPPPAPGEIDPLTDDTAVATRYRFRNLVAELDAFFRVSSSLSTRARLTFRDIAFQGDIDPLDVPITDVYDPERIPGFTHLDPIAGELELIYDTSRPRLETISFAAPSAGWRLAGLAGYQLDLGSDGSRFLRYGADLRRYIDLYRGDRVLILGATLEAVAGDREAIPFIDLPTIGGKHRLRGYPSDRFRDRVAGVVTAEYRYPVSRNLLGFVAADAGRVWRELADVAPEDLRVGFGGGFQLHTHRSFVARLSLFTSIDGGIEVQVVLDPTVPGRGRREP